MTLRTVNSYFRANAFRHLNLRDRLRVGECLPQMLHFEISHLYPPGHLTVTTGTHVCPNPASGQHHTADKKVNYIYSLCNDELETFIHAKVTRQLLVSVDTDVDLYGRIADGPEPAGSRHPEECRRSGSRPPAPAGSLQTKGRSPPNNIGSALGVRDILIASYAVFHTTKPP